MRCPFRRWLRLLAPLALVAACVTPSFAGNPRVGFDQAWLVDHFGTDLTSAFDEGAWRRVFQRTHAAGGTIVRVWLFEGEPGQGILWAAGDAHRPAGVDPTLLAHVRRLAAIAEEEHVQIYWTARDGNWPNYWDEKKTVDSERAWNIDTNKYGFGDAFDASVLGPVIAAIHERPGAVYGFDLLNEAEGMIAGHAWPDGWEGARSYIARQAAFVHARAPGLRVSASAGWGTAARDILDGHFDGLGLDFLDVHVYTDDAKIPRGEDLAAHARAQGVPIVVGELGQAKKDVDPALQARVVKGILEDAARLGFEAVLAWQLEDSEARFTFYDADGARPAYAELLAFAKAHPTPEPGASDPGAPGARDEAAGVKPEPGTGANPVTPPETETARPVTKGFTGALGGVESGGDR